MSRTDFTTTQDYAAAFIAVDLPIVPLAEKSKSPIHDSWQTREFTAGDFGTSNNIGVKLGVGARNLGDADLDHLLAAKLAPNFLPKTGVIFGRASKPLSHYLYEIIGEGKSATFKHPDTGGMICEVRFTGQQTMVPPSVHPSGEVVTFASNDSFGQIAIERLTESMGWLAVAVYLIDKWPSLRGQHHELTLSLTGWLISAGVPVQTVEALIRTVCQYAHDHEPDSRVRNVRDTAARLTAGETVTGRGKLTEILGTKAVRFIGKCLGLGSRDALQGANAAAKYRLHDVGNAERMAEQHVDTLRYCAERKCWYLWNGKYWDTDVTGEATRRAIQTVRRIPDEARELADKDDRTAILKHAIASESGPRIESMVKLAQKHEDLAIRADEFDRDPWLLNTPSGTVDMRSGGLRPHDRDDFITRITAASYKPGAKSKAWTEFLIAATEGIDVLDGERIPTPEEQTAAADLRRLLQQGAGISATGDASEEYAFFVHGPEGSGKSTFIAAITRALGDYAKTTDFETFLKRQHAGGIRTDLVRLNKAYMVASVEVEEGRELAAGLFKRLTGGDEQTARGLYTSEITMQPSATYWLVANHAPRIDASDGAMWRRILRIPFPYTVPKAKRLPGLKKVITDPSITGPAVLTWLVEGALAWQRNGLQIPTSVIAATDELRDEMDRTTDFFDDRCEFAPTATVPIEHLHQSYLDWCRANGVKFPLERRKFGTSVERHGCERAKGSGGVRVWRGVRLNQARISEVPQMNPYQATAGG